MKEEFISIKEASDYLGVSIRTVQRYIKSKKVKYRHINGKTLINKESLAPLKETSEIINATKTDSIKKGPESFDQQIIHDSLQILRDQLRAKDEQIKDLTLSVKELQTTQKLLIEKGLNLRQLGSGEKDDSQDTPKQDDNKIDIAQDEIQPNIISVNIKERAGSPADDLQKHNPANSGSKKNIVIASVALGVALLVLVAIYFFFKISIGS